MILGGKELYGQDLLRTALEYDSSSGMGLFELLTCSEGGKTCAQIHVRNPFTESEGRATSPVSQFLLGYLEGVCSAIFDRNFVASAPTGIRRSGDHTSVAFSLDEQ